MLALHLANNRHKSNRTRSTFYIKSNTTSLYEFHVLLYTMWLYGHKKLIYNIIYNIYRAYAHSFSPPTEMPVSGNGSV